MSKQSSSIFHSTPHGSSGTSRTPTIKSKVTSKSTLSSKVGTPSRTTPGKDENLKPFSTPKCETPLSHYRTARSKNTTPGKRFFDNESKTSKTPFSTFNTKTTKSPSGHKTVTTHSTIRTTPGKSDKFLVEFNDDILITPRGLFTEGDPTTVSVTSTSTVFFDTPMSKRKMGSPLGSPMNRSHSASSIVRNTSQSSNSNNTLKRYHSEVRLSTDVSPSQASNISTKEGESSRVTVGVRVRPLHPREHGNAVFVKGGEVRIASDLGSVHRFTYDKCFPSSGADAVSQEEVYDSLVRPLVDNAFQGYNACLFAYGQTGSGKTYSMMGSLEGQTGITKETGIIPRFCNELISRVSSHDESDSGEKPTVTSTIEISYLEVYNEKIHDLLVPGSNPLKVREHPVFGPYVVDLTKKPVTSFAEFQHWLEIGNKKRATAATEMNDKSSRSHSLFSVILTQTFVQVGNGGNWSHDHTRRSQINLVDLAGSERIAHTSVTSDRLREGVSINRSLLTLGKVITALVEKRSFVPYRESALTWLLKDSLGGNSRTTMLATISPCSSHLEESLATLRYASQARTIVNTVRVNEAPQDKLIRELKAEVERLKEKNNEFERSHSNLATPVHNNELKEVKTDLKKTKEELTFSKSLLDEATKKIHNYSEQIKTCQLEKDELAEKMKIIESEKSIAEKNANDFLEKYNKLNDMVESEKTEKQRFMNSAEDEFQTLLSDYNQLKKQVETQKQELDIVKANLTKTEQDYQNLKEKEELLKTKLSNTEKELEKTKSKNESIITKKTSILKILNSSDCMDDIASKIQSLHDEKIRLQEENSHLSTSTSKIIQEFNSLKSAHTQSDTEYENMKSEIVKLKSELEKYDGENKSLKVLNKALKKELRTTENELKDINEQNNKLQTEKDNLNKNLQESRLSQKNNIDEKLQKLTSLEKELVNLQSQNSTKNEEIQKLNVYFEELLEKRKIVEQLEENMKNLKHSASDLKKELKRKENQIISHQEKIDQIGIEKRKLENTLETHKENNQKLNQELGLTKQEIKKLKEDINALEIDKTKASEAEKRLQEELLTLKNIHSENVVELNKNDKLKSDFEELKVKIQIVADLENEIRNLKHSNTNMKNQLKRKENEMLSLHEKYVELTKDKTNIDNLMQNYKENNEKLVLELASENATKKHLEEKIQTISDECTSLNRQVDCLKNDKDDKSKSKDEAKIKKLKQLIEKLKTQVKQLEEQLQKELDDKIKFKKETDEALKEQAEICDNLKRDLESKVMQMSNVETQLKASQELHREAMEEKLTLVKAMEKQCSNESIQNYKSVLSENNRLKRDLNINDQRLEKKVKKIEKLNERITKLEDIMKLILEEKISFRNQKALLEKALVKKDFDAYEFVMDVAFPHHLQHLTRKARHFAELYRIPYDFLVLKKGTVLIKHLLLSAKALLHHGQFQDWVEKIEETSSWEKSADSDLPWEVDFGDYYDKENEVPESVSEEDLAEADKALQLGARKTRHGVLDPIEWRRMLVKRHVQGIKDDSEILIKYFPDTEDSRVYSILSRIQASIKRLEEITKNVIK